MLSLSETFVYPFTTIRRVQERLSLLSARGFIHRWQYAVPGEGTMNYYTLSKEGYRLVHGPDTPLPGHRAFEPFSISRLFHSQALADFIVHSAVAAHRTGFGLADFHREGSLRLQVDADFLYPDCAFRLTAPDGQSFMFYVELDNGTEPVTTETGHGAYERKIRFYEALKDQRKAAGLDHRFRVVLATTSTEVRLCHLLSRAASLLRVKQRPLVFGITLPAYLAKGDALTGDHFRDNRGWQRALIAPSHVEPGATQSIPIALATVPVL